MGAATSASRASAWATVEQRARKWTCKSPFAARVVGGAGVEAVAEQRFDGSGYLGQQGFGLGNGGATGAQVDLQIAVGGQDGGDRILVFLIHRGDERVEIRD